MAKSEDGSNKGPGQNPQQQDGSNPSDSERQGQQEKVIWEKAPGYDWDVEYQFDEGDSEIMSVFGCMTAEKALEEARYSLNGWNNMNVGTYEIFAIRRTDKL